MTSRASVGLVGLLVLAGCGGPDDPAPDLTAVRAAIIGGSLDPDHDAVVYVLGDGGASCTGTVIATRPPDAWVLSAAHCPATGQIAFTDDVFGDCVQSPPCELYPIAEAIPHPRYETVTYTFDFMLYRFTGA